MCGCFFVLTTYLYTFAFFTIGREANKDKPIEGANDFFGCFVFFAGFSGFWFVLFCICSRKVWGNKNNGSVWGFDAGGGSDFYFFLGF